MSLDKEPFFEIEGVFYTYQDGPMSGYAYTLGDCWQVILDDGSSFTRTTIYLDRDKLVTAPHNKRMYDWSSRRVDELISRYQEKVDDLGVCVNVLGITTFEMKYSIVLSYLNEYKSLKFSYFVGNALKFILF